MRCKLKPLARKVEPAPVIELPEGLVPQEEVMNSILDFLHGSEEESRQGETALKDWRNRRLGDRGDGVFCWMVLSDLSESLVEDPAWRRFCRDHL